MTTGSQVPTDTPPTLVLRGRLQFRTLDVSAPVLGLGIAIIGSAAAVGFSFYASDMVLMQNIEGVGATVGIISALVGILFLIVVGGWRGARDELAVFDERIVIRPGRRDGSGVGLVIPFCEVERLALDKSWIRLRQKSGRRWSFKGPRLHVGDAFDLLAEKVGAVNPSCVILDR